MITKRLGFAGRILRLHQIENRFAPLLIPRRKKTSTVSHFAEALRRDLLVLKINRFINCSCGRGGNAIKFIEEIERKSSPQGNLFGGVTRFRV